MTDMIAYNDKDGPLKTDDEVTLDLTPLIITSLNIV